MANTAVLENVREIIRHTYKTIILQALVQIQNDSHYCIFLKINFQTQPMSNEQKVIEIGNDLYILIESRTIYHLSGVIEYLKRNKLPLYGKNGKLLLAYESLLNSFFDLGNNWETDSTRDYAAEIEYANYPISLLKSRNLRRYRFGKKDSEMITKFFNIKNHELLPSIIIVLPILCQRLLIFRGRDGLVAKYLTHKEIAAGSRCRISIDSSKTDNQKPDFEFNYDTKNLTSLDSTTQFLILNVPIPSISINPNYSTKIIIDHTTFNEIEIDSIEGTKIINYINPPIGIRAITHLAWGLTMNLSEEDKQNKLGEDVREFWKKFIPSYGQTEEVELKQSESNNNIDPIAERYLQNIFASLSAYLRSIGYERNVYVAYLDAQKNIRDQSIAYWNDLADLVSFSKDGLLIRLASFFGIGGSTILTSTNFFGFIPGGSLFSSIQNNASQALKQAAISLNGAADKLLNKSDVAKLLNEESSKLTGKAESLQQVVLPYEIIVFLIAGFTGMMAVIIFLRWYRTRRIKGIFIGSLEEQQKYWEKIARPSFRQSLLHLTRDVAEIMKFYYNEYYNMFIKDLEIKEIIDDILPKQQLYANSRYLFTWPKGDPPIEIQGADKDRIVELLLHTIGIPVSEKTRLEKDVFIIEKTAERIVNIFYGNRDHYCCTFELVYSKILGTPKCYLKINNDRSHEYLVVRQSYGSEEVNYIYSRVI